MRAEEIVLDACCDVFGVKVGEIISSKRNREIVNARHCAMTILKRHYKRTFAEIGRLFSRDHSAVIYAVETFEHHLQNESLTKELYSRVHNKVMSQDVGNKYVPTKIVIHYKGDISKMHGIIRELFKKEPVTIEII
jgi:hypothetical protein